MSKDIPGAKPVPISQLIRAQDRLTFVYLEHCVVHRDANAITAQDERGTVHIPAAALGALLLGPGTNVSQQAMVLLAESGSTAVWVGEHGVRGHPMAAGDLPWRLPRQDRISARVRALVWQRVTEMVKTGRAIMVYGANNEQGLTFEVHGHDWVPVDFEGIHLMLRPNKRATPTKTGWSTASKRRRYGRAK